LAILIIGAQNIRGKGLFTKNALGVCHTNTYSLNTPGLSWDEGEWMYCLDKKLFKEYSNAISKKGMALQRRHFRADVSHLLAGEISVNILNGEESDWIEPNDYSDRGEDAVKADAICRFLLPFNSEYYFSIEETERVLREPEIWERVLNLASALEEKGCIEDEELDAYLPEPRKNWPPSPRAKKED